LIHIFAKKFNINNMAIKPFSLLIVAFWFFLFTSCHSNTNGTNNNKEQTNATGTPAKLTIIHFDTNEHDFGTITQGEKVVYSFKFTNTGKNPLSISNVRASCGCTVTDYPKGQVKPGDGSSIEVRFNTEGKKGFQSKTVSVIANTDPAETQLFFKAIVQEPQSGK
jgi:hypothetical protein